MADLPSILGGMAQGFLDFGKSAVDLFGTGGASIADLIESARTGKVTTKNSDDFRKWLYDTNDVKDAAAKGLGTALNGVQTVSDYIPGIGAVTRNPLFNAGQGALGGLADEFKMYGKDYDLGRAGQRAAVGAGGALASTGLADALKGSGNALLKSGTAQGLARGAVGGAIGAGGYTAIDGGSLGDVANSALQGAGMGAALGGTMGALQDFRPAKTYDMALTDEEKAARIANAKQMLETATTPERRAELQEQISRLGGTPENTVFYHGQRNTPSESGDTLGSGLYVTSNKDRAAQYADGGDVLSYDTNGLRIANLDNNIPDDVIEVLNNNPELRAKLNTLTPATDFFDNSQRDKAYALWKELQQKYPMDQISSKRTDAGYEITYPKDADLTKITGKDLFRKLYTPEAQNVFMGAGYDGVSKTALGGDTEMAIYRNAPKNLEATLADADMAVNNPRYLTDENGNPRTFYHGSPNKNITEFDINQAGKNTSSGEHALYFTDSPEVADEFSYERLPSDSMFVDNRGAKGRVYPVNLAMDNPLDLSNLSDKQIEELWQYASPLGKLDGKEKFIKNMKAFRDYGNDQLIKTNLDLDKLANSQYDGFTARMYPNQDNQAREYAVFDNSKIKMLEDALAVNDANTMASRMKPGEPNLGRTLANQDLSVNSAPETAAVIAGKNRGWDELYDMLSKDAGAFENEDRTPITASPSQLRSEIQAIDAEYPNDMPDDIWDKRYGLNQQLKAAEKGYNSPYDYYVGESKKNFRQDFESRPDKYKAKIADIESQAQRQAALDQDIANASPRKLAQFNLIQQKNPAPNETLTWIRSPKDILTWDEAIAGAEGDNAFTWPDYTLEDALRDQKKHSMTVYSSYPIKGGTFVTPSRQQASDYAGGGRVYSKVIRPDDVAWINGDEGQYAYTRKK